MEREDHVKLGLWSWKDGPLAAAEVAHPQVPRKGSPFRPLGLPSSGGPRIWEPERNGALWDQLDRNEAESEGGDTRVGWQALLYPLCTAMCELCTRDPCPQENLRKYSVNGFNPRFSFSPVK